MLPTTSVDRITRISYSSPDYQLFVPRFDFLIDRSRERKRKREKEKRKNFNFNDTVNRARGKKLQVQVSNIFSSSHGKDKTL